MSQMYYVSILVPVYKVEGQIERCAHSLFGQSFQSIEYIFVDDASPDQSIAYLERILEKYPERKEHVTILHHDQNEGLWKARTTALRAAHGEYIWCVDSDDFIAADAVEKLYNAALQGNADLVTCNFADVYPNGTLHERLRKVPGKKKFLQEILAGKLLPYLVLLFCKRTIYTDYDILPVPNVNFGEDYGLTPRLIAKADIIVSIPDILYFYVHDNVGSYCSVWKNDYIQQRTLVLNALNKFFKDSDPVYKECINRNIIRMKCHFYRMYAASNKPDPADLRKINEWHAEIPLGKLVKMASLPYKPAILLGTLHWDFCLRYYIKTCRFIYRKLIKICMRPVRAIWI